MDSSKPVIFLVTGAWHVPEHYQMVSHGLRHQGYTVECPVLKTNNNANPPNMTLDDDVHQIRSMTLQYLDAGRDIVALMHSYGGIVGSSAFAGLGVADKKTPGHVRALIYMAAFLPFENESLAGIFGGQLPPFLSDNSQGLIDIHDPEGNFYNDLSPQQQSRYAGLLVVHPVVAQYEAIRDTMPRAAWRSIPVTYLICTEDQALPAAVQEMMVTRIEKAEEGLVVNREYLAASHSPFLSMPNTVVASVRRVCEVGSPLQERQASAMSVSPDAQAPLLNTDRQTIVSH